MKGRHRDPRPGPPLIEIARNGDYLEYRRENPEWLRQPLRVDYWIDIEHGVDARRVEANYRARMLAAEHPNPVTAGQSGRASEVGAPGDTKVHDIHGVVDRAKLDKLAALADPARNSNENERRAAATKAAELKSDRKPRARRRGDREPVEIVSWEDALERLFPGVLARAHTSPEAAMEVVVPGPLWKPGERPSPPHPDLDRVVDWIINKKLGREKSLAANEETERKKVDIHVAVRRRIVFAANIAGLKVEGWRAKREDDKSLARARTDSLKLKEDALKLRDGLDHLLYWIAEEPFLSQFQLGMVEQPIAQRDSARTELLAHFAKMQESVQVLTAVAEEALAGVADLAQLEVERTAGITELRCWTTIFVEALAYKFVEFFGREPPSFRSGIFNELVQSAYTSIGRPLPKGRKWESLERHAEATKKLVATRPSWDRWLRFKEPPPAESGAPRTRRAFWTD